MWREPDAISSAFESADETGAAEFFDKAVDHTVDCVDRSVVQAGLHACDRIGSDDGLRLPEIHQRQPGGPGE